MFRPFRRLSLSALVLHSSPFRPRLSHLFGLPLRDCRDVKISSLSREISVAACRPAHHSSASLPYAFPRLCTASRRRKRAALESVTSFQIGISNRAGIFGSGMACMSFDAFGFELTDRTPRRTWEHLGHFSGFKRVHVLRSNSSACCSDSGSIQFCSTCELFSRLKFSNRAICPYPSLPTSLQQSAA